MSKNLYQFAGLTGASARAVLQIVREHPEVCDATTGVRVLAAFERGDDVAFDSGPVGELDHVIASALGASDALDVAFYRGVVDTWNRTALALHPWIAEHWPFLETQWIAFLATGAAAITSEHKNWLSFAPRPTAVDISKAVDTLHLSREDSSAFITAMFDWIHCCRETKCVGIMTARTLGPCQADDELDV